MKQLHNLWGAGHFGFTGTQKGLRFAQACSLVRLYVDLWQNGYRYQHNGDCIGADEESAGIWMEYECGVILHPPEIAAKRAFVVGAVHTYKPRPYLERNRVIVDESHGLVACPGSMEEELRSGTWSTVRYARSRKKRIAIVWPDGQITKEWEWS